jgi:hypothetical protein
MSAHKLYWKVRDQLVEWGVITRPRCYMRRQPAGMVRRRLTARGTPKRFRHVSLARLLDC